MCLEAFVTITSKIGERIMSENDQIVSLVNQEEIQNKIYTIRGVQVMLDRDLAELYKIPTKILNQAVKRNTKRFPADCVPRTYLKTNTQVWNYV